MTAITNDISTQTLPRSTWLKRAGLVGFWFFFIKGLLWLVAPVFFYVVMQGA